MAVRVKKVGSGITAVSRTTYSGKDMRKAADANFNKWSEAIDEGGGNFRARTLGIVKFCCRLLQKQSNLKHQIEAASRPAVQKLLEPLNIKIYPRDSEAWFAQQIVRHFEITKAAIERGESDVAARFGYELGELVATACMKFNWEPDALRGQKALDSTKSGHAAVYGSELSKVAQWTSIDNDYQQELAAGTKREAAKKIVAEKHGVSTKTVQRAGEYLSGRGIKT